MLRRIEHVRLSQSAVEQIKELIAKRELHPGDRLPGERELVRQLGISRTSVREALRILEVMGLVEVRPGSGTYVKDPTADVMQAPLTPWLAAHRDSLMELFEVRELIEPGAAALAAQRACPHTIQAMRQTLEEMERAHQDGDLVGAVMADAEFHHLIMKATGNKLLIKLLDNIVHLLEEGRKASLRVPGQTARAIAGHRQILEAIAANDGEAAARAMSTHLRDAKFYMLQELERQDLSSTLFKSG